MFADPEVLDPKDDWTALANASVEIPAPRTAMLDLLNACWANDLTSEELTGELGDA